STACRKAGCPISPLTTSTHGLRRQRPPAPKSCERPSTFRRWDVSRSFKRRAERRLRGSRRPAISNRSQTATARPSCHSARSLFRRWQRHPPQREVDPAAFRQQGRRARYDPIDAVERQTRLAAEHDGITGGEAHGAGRIAALRPPNAKEAGIAERQRNHRRLEVELVAVL